MKQEYKLNRLEAAKLIGPMVDKHWEDLRTAKERGQKVAWVSSIPFIFCYAMDMKSHFMAGYSAYAAGRKGADELLEIAEADGELRDTCSYHRLHMGMATALKQGIPIKHKDVLLPIPDVMITGRACPEMSHYAEGLYRRLGIPVIPVDLPMPHDESEMPILEAYVERQFRETLIPALEKICGRPFNYDRMSEIMVVLKEAATIRNECWEFFKLRPSPWTLWDYSIGLAPLIHLMGKPEGVVFYKQVRAELEQRAAGHIPAISPEERYRLCWDGWIPWGFLGMFARKLTSLGAVPLCGRYPWEFFPHPEWIEPEPDPVHTFVKACYRGRLLTRSAAEVTMYLFKEWIEDYKLDGIVFFDSKTCRIWKGQLEMMNVLEKTYGIPGIVIEGDMADSTFISEAQVDTRLEALCEMMEGRRRATRQ